MSNINNNNQMKEVCSKLLNMIPVEEFYSNILTRVNILNIYEKHMQIIRTLPIDENNVIRCLTHNFLRYINMSIQQLDVLMFLGLQQVTINDLKLSYIDLINKLVSQNKDTTDIHIIERILSQINNNLPQDLRGKFTPAHKYKIIKLLNEYTPFKDNLKYFHDTQGQGNKEHFTSLDNNFLDTFSNDNNNNGEFNLNNLPNANDYNYLKKKGYDLKDYLNNVKMEINHGTYENQLKEFINERTKMKQVIEDANNKETSDDKLRAMYINKKPDIHYSPTENQFYFYEHASGSLVDESDVETILNLEIDANKPKLSLEQKKLFEHILKKYNIPRDKLDNAVKYIETIDNTYSEEEEMHIDTNNKDYDSVNNLKKTTKTEQTSTIMNKSNTLSTIKNMFKSNYFLLIVISLLICIIIIYIYTIMKNKILNNIYNKTINQSQYNTMKNNKSSTVRYIRSDLQTRFSNIVNEKSKKKSDDVGKGKIQQSLVQENVFRKIK